MSNLGAIDKLEKLIDSYLLRIFELSRILPRNYQDIGAVDEERAHAEFNEAVRLSSENLRSFERTIFETIVNIPGSDKSSR